MERISHRNLEVNGITMHVAEIGEGQPAVLFLHGFLELWYSWRHQMLSLSEHGYRCIAPDLHGYGDTSAPPSASSYTLFHIVGDLVALLDARSLSHVFVVGQGWGAIAAWHLCMFRPDRVKALVNLSMPFMPRNPMTKPIENFRRLYGDDYYVCRLQEPGVMEEQFARLGTRFLLKKILTTGDPGPLILSDESRSSPEEQISLPKWISEQDIDYFVSKFEKSGFTGGMNYYRCLDINWELTAPWTGAKVNVPSKFIIGELDITYHYPKIKDYIHNGGFKNDVPLLDEIAVIEGAGHFIHLERALQVSNHIYEFIQKF